MVCNEEQPNTAHDAFMKVLIPVTNMHAPIKKMTVKTVKSPGIDEELKNGMVERDEAQGIVTTSAKVGPSPCSGGVRRSTSPAF